MNSLLLRQVLALLGCLLLALDANGAAQDDETLAPPIRQPSARMTWKMTLCEHSTPADTNTNPHAVTSLTIVKNGEVSRVVMAKKDGTAVQYWRSGNCTLVYDRKRNKVLPVTDHLEIPPYPFASPGFYGIEKANAADEQKPASFEQARCRYFRGTDYEAWFDAKTGLPRAFRNGGITFVFQFAPVPEDVHLPPEYQAAVDRHRANLIHAGLLPRD